MKTNENFSCVLVFSLNRTILVCKIAFREKANALSKQFKNIFGNILLFKEPDYLYKSG